MPGKLEYNKIYFRALEPDDIDWLYECENNTDVWEVSNSRLPFSKHILKKYIENAQTEIYTHGQIRFVVCNKSNERIGIADVFDFDIFNKRAGIGIMISSEYRNKNYGSDSIELLKIYCKKNLLLHQIYCNISENNTKSISLFEKSGFIKTGIKKDWQKTINSYQDEMIYQYLFD